MEPVKFALLLLLAAFAQVVCTLGSPLSSEDDGDLWTEQNWQVNGTSDEDFYHKRPKKSIVLFSFTI